MSAEEHEQTFQTPSHQSHLDSSHAISGSHFGNNARLHLGNVIYNLCGQKRKLDSLRGAGTDFTDDDFLTCLSDTDPCDKKDAIKLDNPESWETAFHELLAESKLLDDWLDDSASRFVWIQDETGVGHPILSAKMLEYIDSSPKRQDLLVAYLFRQQRHSVADVVAGLAYTLLVHPSLQDTVLPHISKEFYNKIRTCRKDRSDFYLVSKVLQLTLAIASQSLPTKRFLLIVDGLDCCHPARDRNSGISQLLSLFNSFLGSYGTMKLMFTTVATGEEISPSLKALQEGNIKGIGLLMDPPKVAKALGLTKALEQVTIFGHTLQKTYTDLKASETNEEDLSWFDHCSVTQEWLQEPRGLDTHLLWYRRKSQAARCPSQLALSVADFRPLQSQDIKAYLSLFSLLNPRSVSLDSVSHERIHPSQILWSLFALLLVLTCRSESEVAHFIVSLPSNHRRAFKISCSDLAWEHDRVTTTLPGAAFRSQSSFPENPPHTCWASPIRTLPLDSLYRRTKALGDGDLLGSGHLIKSVLGKGRRQGCQMTLVLDAVEVVEVRDYQEVLAVLQTCAVPIRILSCVNTSIRPELVEWERTTRHPWIDELTEYEGQSRENPSCLPLMRSSTDSNEYTECMQRLRCEELLCCEEPPQHVVGDASSHTNEWLWSHRQFLKWKDCGGLLWIRGKPGSGKSVLAKSIRKNLRRSISSTLRDTSAHSVIVYSWFYTSRDLPRSRQHAPMLRSLIRTILAESISLYYAIRRRHRSFISEHHRCPCRWPFDSLRELLELLLSASTTPDILAIVDGLDESEDNREHGPSRLSVLNMLLEMTVKSPRRVRIVLLSRSTPDIMSRLRHMNIYRIATEQHNQADISILIESGIQRLNISPNSFNIEEQDLRRIDITPNHSMSQAQTEHINDLRKYLINKARGIILWVVLVFEQLETLFRSSYGFTMSDLKISLDTSLPMKQFFLHVQPQNLHDPQARQHLLNARKFLSWIVGSRNKTEFQLRELWEAVAIPIPEDSLNGRSEFYGTDVSARTIKDERFQIWGNWDKFSRIIFQHCGFLVEIVPANGLISQSTIYGTRVDLSEVSSAWTVQLFHDTIGTLLQSREASGQFFIDANTANAMVQSVSHQYLGLAVPQRHPSPILTSNPEGKIGALEAILTPSRTSDGRVLDSLATKALWKARPMLRFALEIVTHNYSLGSIMDTLTNVDQGSLSPEHYLVVCWSADLCFTPGTSRTKIRSTVLSFCLSGRHDILEAISLQVQGFKENYRDECGQRFEFNRFLEIIKAVIECLGHLDPTFLTTCPDYNCCLWWLRIQQHLLSDNDMKGEAIKAGIRILRGAFMPDTGAGGLLRNIAGPTRRVFSSEQEQSIMRAVHHAVNLAKQYSAQHRWDYEESFSGLSDDSYQFPHDQGNGM